MQQKFTRAVIALALAATLSACAATERVVERPRIVRPQAPAALFYCGEEPENPPLACVDEKGESVVCDEAAGIYGTILREWGRGCAGMLRAVGEVVGR